MKITGTITGIKVVHEWQSNPPTYGRRYRLTLRVDDDGVGEAEVYLDGKPPVVGQRFTYRDGDDQVIDGTARPMPPALRDTTGDA